MRRLAPLAMAAALSACGMLNRNELPAELGGAWIVQQIAGASLGEGVEIYFEIDATAGAITGFTGCNRFKASMTAFEGALSVGAVQEQPGGCASEAASTDETRFLRVLPSVQRYVRRGKSLELLQMGDGEALLRLREDNFANPTTPGADPSN